MTNLRIGTKVLPGADSVPVTVTAAAASTAVVQAAPAPQIAAFGVLSHRLRTPLTAIRGLSGFF